MTVREETEEGKTMYMRGDAAAPMRTRRAYMHMKVLHMCTATHYHGIKPAYHHTLQYKPCAV